MKLITLIVSMSLFVALTGCGESEAERQAQKGEAYKKAMLDKMADQRAKSAKKAEENK
jgi:hypothetical protein